ncbi:Uncharacterised protein [Mycobacteroides abscessus subsp. abscessus]|nr:Uncharacterised protein [Mycobacteroides abscessus subsp. abscessus]
MRVGIPARLSDLISFTLSGFHDLTARIDRVRGALNTLRNTLNHRDRILGVHRTGLRRRSQRRTGLCGRTEPLRGLPRRLPDLLPGLHISLHIAREALHRLRSILSQCLGIRPLLVVLLTPPRGRRTQQQRGQVVVTRLLIAVLLVAILLIVLRREPRRLLLFLVLLVLLLQLFGQIIDALAVLSGLLLLILQLPGQIIDLLLIRRLIRRLVGLLRRILLRLLRCLLLHTLIRLPAL